ncbi:DEAD/DEAH box helicase family protein [Oceanobacillus kimchii]|uniref:Helicase ATP-binding domain-containing protein n=1 Tax=Oceanobacillus kimchii TaxID=746691 RepID=A0ABQ5TQ92_9BACI|nr:DEAD/DEAH box helicase family protein [Oceanobacillus kimchii]GLO68024.1 hypothetical protein MACH08_38080 [Oceanobacillus kimchii]
MEKFPSDIQFKYPWRSYQQKVIDDMETFLEKRHLHLVAPPGSGKTVIGLEMMLRFNQATLILAPTIAIRNQWIHRFIELFYQKKEKPDWITTDLENPGLVTVSTYQGFHQWMTKEKDVSKVLLAKQIKTLVLDEAHHLRTAWWKSAMRFENQLSDPAIVALTATPPYDVTVQEWDRYIELCGEIDAEISIAELVRESELAPFQDYVWMSNPMNTEKEKINRFRRHVNEYQEQIRLNSSFIEIIESHPYINESSLHTEEILSDPTYFVSMLIFLKEAGSGAWLEPVKITGVKTNKLPELNLEWLEILLSRLLYKETLVDMKQPVLDEQRKYLKRLGAIERQKVFLTSNKRLNRILVQSPSKLNSIEEIARLEASALKEQLRMVILTDYIRKEDLPTQVGDEKELRRLGAVPIFEKLRREGLEFPVGVVTGSLSIIPKKALIEVNKLANKWNIDVTKKELPHDPRFVEISLNSTANHRMVQLMTILFEQGHIKVLIGTTALLGEGWDAPSINSLILASYVGSFMLSNQMRGRAIRVEKGNPTKTANIWHLVCLDPTRFDGGEDYLSLTRRFEALIGLGHTKGVIQSGINRLDIAEPPFRKLDIDTENKKMLSRSSERSRLFKRWKEAVEVDGKLKEKLRTDKSQVNVPSMFIFGNTVKALIASIAATISFFVLFMLILSDGNEVVTGSTKTIFIFVTIFIIIGIMLASRNIWKLLKITYKNISVEKSLGQIGEVIYHSLYEAGLADTNPKGVTIKTDEFSANVFCWVEDCTIYDQNIYLHSLLEVCDPIQNPRYIIRREAKALFRTKVDYHTVPYELAKNKETAEIFLKHWVERLGKAELIYTRTTEGRKVLLEARTDAMSSEFVSKSQQLSVWE